MYLGDSHKGLQWVLHVLCPQSFDTSLSGCLPVNKIIFLISAFKVAQSSFLTFLILILRGIDTTTLFHLYP